MLREKPNPLIQAWWRWYCPFALRKHFHRVMLYGELASPLHSSSGTLYLANHLSFWDGIVLSHLLHSHYGEEQPRCMIDEAQIARHPFFRRVGGFSVDRTSPRDALRAIAHAADLLSAGHGVVLFPQGRIVPGEAPMQLERGFTYILDRAPRARVVALALRYEFWNDQRPELLVHLARPEPASTFGFDTAVTLLSRGLADLRRASLTRTPGEVVLRGRRSIAELFPRVPMAQRQRPRR